MGNVLRGCATKGYIESDTWYVCLIQINAQITTQPFERQIWINVALFSILFFNTHTTTKNNKPNNRSTVWRKINELRQSPECILHTLNDAITYINNNKIMQLNAFVRLLNVQFNANKAEHNRWLPSAGAKAWIVHTNRHVIDPQPTRNYCELSSIWWWSVGCRN